MAGSAPSANRSAARVRARQRRRSRLRSAAPPSTPPSRAQARREHVEAGRRGQRIIWTDARPAPLPVGRQPGPYPRRDAPPTNMAAAKSKAAQADVNTRPVIRSDHTGRPASVTRMTSNHPPPRRQQEPQRARRRSTRRDRHRARQPCQHHRLLRAGHPGVYPRRETFTRNDVPLCCLHQRGDRIPCVLGELPTHGEPPQCAGTGELRVTLCRPAATSAPRRARAATARKDPARLGRRPPRGAALNASPGGRRRAIRRRAHPTRLAALRIHLPTSGPKVPPSAAYHQRDPDDRAQRQHRRASATMNAKTVAAHGSDGPGSSRPRQSRMFRGGARRRADRQRERQYERQRRGIDRSPRHGSSHQTFSTRRIRCRHATRSRRGRGRLPSLEYSDLVTGGRPFGLG